ncbi:hypothetical protein TrST_g5023 [Triparma strigata]|nr:hypothetical protein TrST_g5023 [Triparma strigata]
MQRAMGDVVPAAADGSEGPTAAPIIADACYDTTVESSRAQNPWDNTCFGVCYENLFGPSYPRPCQYRTGKTSADWTEAQVGELSSFVDATGGTPVDSCGSYELVDEYYPGGNAWNYYYLICTSCAEGFSGTSRSFSLTRHDGTGFSYQEYYFYVYNCQRDATAAPTATPTNRPTSAPTTMAPTASICSNGKQDTGETAVDCGGSLCPPCDDYLSCIEPTDCKSGVCGLDKTCAATTTAPTASPTGAPTPSPTPAPTTLAPTPAATIAPTETPETFFTCNDNSKCWTGNEGCCDRITTNMFVSSLLTERILFYDLQNKNYQLFHQNRQKDVIGADGQVTGTSSSLPMSFDPGASHVAFNGEYILFAQKMVDGEAGLINRFNWQDGQNPQPTLRSSQFQSLTGSSRTFDPGVLRYNNDFDLLLLSDRGSSTRGNDKLYLWSFTPYSAQIILDSACTIVDVAMEKTKDAARVEVLVLVKCSETDFKVKRLVIGVTKSTGSITLDTSSTFEEWSLPISYGEARSIEWVADYACSGDACEASPDVFTNRFFVAFEPTSDATEHIREFTSAGQLTSSFLTLGDLDGNRYGIDLGMIRRAPNGLIYASERRFGLPLVIDPNRPTQAIIGQTGASHGELADSFAMAFSSNAYGLKSQVVWNTTLTERNRLGETLTAGDKIGFQVVLRDSLDVATSRPTKLDYALTGKVLVGEEESESTILRPAGETTAEVPTKLNSTLVAEKASLSGDDANHKWAFKVQLSGLEMQIGDETKFWVQPAKTSPVTTLLEDTFKTSTAGESITTSIHTYDKFENKRTFGDVEEDESDSGKFKCFNSNLSNDPSLDPKCVITRSSFGVFQVKIDSDKADTYAYEITYDDEPIVNSPFFFTFKPAEISGSHSTVTGIENNFEPAKDGETEQRSIYVSLRDRFSNFVPVPSNSTRNLTVEEWSEQEKMLGSVNITLKELKFAKVSEYLIGAFMKPYVDMRRSQCLLANNATNKNGDRYDELYEVCDSQARAADNFDEYAETEKEVMPDGNIKVTFSVDGPEYLYIVTTVLVKNEGGGWKAAKANTRDRDGVSLTAYEWRPAKLVIETTYSDKEMFVLMGVSSFALFYNVLIFFLVWFWQNENAIKFSQRRMLNIMLAGFFILNVVIFLQSFPFFYTWEGSCAFDLYFSSFGGGLVFSVMLAKLYRVNKIAFAKANKKVVITDKFLLQRIGALFAVSTIYFCIAIYVCPTKYLGETSPKPVDTDSFDSEKYIKFYKCDWDPEKKKNSNVWTPFFVMGVLIVVLLLFTASLNRKIPSAFAEGKYIAWTIYILFMNLMLSLAIVYDPMIKFTSPGVYRGGYLIPTIASILIGMSFIFVPKFLHIIQATNIDIADLTKYIKRGSLKNQAGGNNGGGDAAQQQSNNQRSNTVASTMSSTSAVEMGRTSTMGGTMVGSPPGRSGKFSGRVSGTSSFKSSFAKRTTTQESTALSSSMSSDDNMSSGSPILSSFGGSTATLNPLSEANNDEEEDESETASLQQKPPRGSVAPPPPPLSSASGQKQLQNELSRIREELKKKEQDNLKLKQKLQNQNLQIKRAKQIKAQSSRSISQNQNRIPEGSPWQKFQDHKGEMYYYHSVTKDCRYERPDSWF